MRVTEVLLLGLGFILIMLSFKWLRLPDDYFVCVLASYLFTANKISFDLKWRRLENDKRNKHGEP